MKLHEIACFRLLSQQIASPTFKSAKQLVSYMGAVQAQDYSMAKWAVALRLQNSSEKKIEKAIHDGEILRTHLMRPTWHFVSADDIHWMIELTAPRMKAGVKSRHKYLGLSEKLISKSNTLIEKSLRDGNHLTREEIMAILAKAKIPLNAEMPIHLMFRAETDGIVCSGKIKSNKQTYALLAERVPEKRNITKEEALALLAKKYFTSHVPAALKDFIWWSGLSAKDAQHGLEMVKQNFIAEKINGEIYWITNSFNKNIGNNLSAFLLPAFDEFLISYKNRTASLILEHNRKAVSSNGIFWPVIVINGKVMGSWKRIFQAEKTVIKTNFFEPVNKHSLRLINDAALKFGNFLGHEIEIVHKSRF